MKAKCVHGFYFGRAAMLRPHHSIGSQVFVMREGQLAAL
jgi:hypothetical protein